MDQRRASCIGDRSWSSVSSTSAKQTQRLKKSRLGTQLGPCDDDGGESEAGEIVSSEAVVSGCDASPILELAEQAFDDVSALIGGAIERVWHAPRGGGGNGRSDLPMLEPSAQTVGVVGLVRKHALWLSDGAEKRNGHDDVGDVSWRQRESDRSAAIIGQSMDLARPSAPRAADRFFKLPLFEPLAERCALTWLLSIESSSGRRIERSMLTRRCGCAGGCASSTKSGGEGAGAIHSRTSTGILGSYA